MDKYLITFSGGQYKALVPMGTTGYELQRYVNAELAKFGFTNVQFTARKIG